MVSVEFDADGKPEVSTSKARFAGYHMDDILLWNEVGEGIRSVHFFRSEEVGRTEYRKVDQSVVRTARRNVKKPLNNDPEIVVEPERHMDLFLGYSYRDATSLSLAYRFDPGKVAFDYHIINRSTVRGSGEFKEGDYQLAALMDFADGLEEVYKMPGTGAEGRREYYQAMMTILGIPVYPGWDRMFSFDEPLHP